MSHDIIVDASLLLGQSSFFKVSFDETNKNSNIVSLLNENEVLPHTDAFAVSNGLVVSSIGEAADGVCVKLYPQLCAGKGGFGSMLRAIGTQIEKTTNREACRDLSGRRMRDINNEKKLRDWVAGAAEREREKAEKKRERQQQILAPKQHKFDDGQYEQQKRTTLDSLDDALFQGLQKSSGSKRPAQSKTGGPVSKKGAMWLGVDSDECDTSSGSDEDVAEPSSACSDRDQPSSSPAADPDQPGSSTSHQCSDHDQPSVSTSADPGQPSTVSGCPDTLSPRTGTAADTASPRDTDTVAANLSDAAADASETSVKRSKENSD